MKARRSLVQSARIGRFALAGLIAGATIATAGSAVRAQNVGPRAQLAEANCPTQAAHMPPDALSGATLAALAQARGLYPAINTRGVEATRAARAHAAGPRGVQIRRECGRRAAERSVVVDLLFPRMRPSASLSQGTVFVDLESGRYRVWRVAH